MTLINRAKAALEGATPGPWGITPHTTYKEEAIDGEFDNIGPVRVDYIYHVDDIWIVCPPPDADLIALAPDLARLAVAAGELAEAIEELIASSDGVYGLHLNGDPAPWGSLTEGGSIQEWLLPLARFRAIAGEAGE